jgi:hypothetical protein
MMSIRKMNSRVGIGTWMILLFCPCILLAQLQEVSRFEQKIPKKLDYTFDVLPLVREKKVIVFGERENWEEYNKRRKYYFKLLDSTLKQTDEKEYPIDRKWIYEGKYTDSTHLYLLFYTDNHKEFAIITYKPGEEVDFRQGEVPFMFTPSSFVVFGNNAFLIGRNRGKDVMIDFSFFDNSVKIVPAYFDDKYDIKNIEINRQESIANVLIQETKRGDKSFYIRRLLSNGKQISENKFTFDKEKYPTDLEPFTINNEHYLIGLYGEGQTHIYSQGWIWTKYDPENPKQPYILQKSFDFVKNFFVYLPRKNSQERERNKVLKMQEKGKSYRYKLRFRLHKPVFYNNQIIVVAESFHTAYQYNNTTYLPLPNTYTNPTWMNSVASSNRNWRYGASVPTYQFVHAIVLAFDLQGELLWDNAIRIKDITSASLKEYVTVSLQKDKTILLQCHERGINMKVCRQNEVIYEAEDVPYQKEYNVLPRKEDKIKPTENQVFAWFDDYVLVSGIYNPKANKFLTTEEDVFYIAKVKFIKPNK